MVDTNTPVISIDPKKNRIRIYKRTLKIMGIPKYIQVLVNPNSSVVAFQGLDKRPSYQYHRINPKIMDRDSSFEIYSSYLVKKLKDICADWPYYESYKIKGKFYPKDRVVSFDLHTAFPIRTEGVNTNE